MPYSFILNHKLNETKRFFDWEKLTTATGSLRENSPDRIKK